MAVKMERDPECLWRTTYDTACDGDDSDLDVVPGGWIIPAQEVNPGSSELLAEDITTIDV